MEIHIEIDSMKWACSKSLQYTQCYDEVSMFSLGQLSNFHRDEVLLKYLKKEETFLILSTGNVTNSVLSILI